MFGNCVIVVLTQVQTNLLKSTWTKRKSKITERDDTPTNNRSSSRKTDFIRADFCIRFSQSQDASRNLSYADKHPCFVTTELVVKCNRSITTHISSLSDLRQHACVPARTMRTHIGTPIRTLDARVWQGNLTQSSTHTTHGCWIFVFNAAQFYRLARRNFTQHQARWTRASWFFNSIVRVFLATLTDDTRKKNTNECAIVRTGAASLWFMSECFAVDCLLCMCGRCVDHMCDVRNNMCASVGGRWGRLRLFKSFDDGIVSVSEFFVDCRRQGVKGFRSQIDRTVALAQQTPTTKHTHTQNTHTDYTTTSLV